MTASKQRERRKAQTTLIEDQQRQWFDEFWSLYWRKAGKKPTWETWKKLVTSETLFSAIRAAVVKQTPAMLTREPERRPHAKTWLNQERWNDGDDPAPIPVAPKSRLDEAFANV